MNYKITTYPCNRIGILVILLLFSNHSSSQFLLQKGKQSENISIHNKTEYVDVGNVDVSFQQIKNIRHSPPR